jgi:hypothetical protein
MDPGVIARARAAAQTLMTDTCTISTAAGATRYTGPCRLQSPQGQTVSIGSVTATVVQAQLQLPIAGTDLVARDDQVVIDAAAYDPALAGRTFAIQDLPLRSHASSRRLAIEEAQVVLLLHDTVTRVRAPLTAGPYGGQQRDWSNTSSVAYPAEVQPVSSTEAVVDADRTVTRWRVVVGPGAAVAATDRIVWDGGTYEVDGDVERWKHRGVLHHLEAVLMRVTEGA